jgi:NADPH:quinone reductase-like Zn-dependent oxidoreductase
MKAMHIDGKFGLENLVVKEIEPPTIRHGCIRLEMKAASLNYRDWLTVMGEYNPRQPLPLVPLSDGVGEVIEVGEGVTSWKVGDRCSPIFAQRWLQGKPTTDGLRSTLGGPLQGVLAEQLVIPADSVVRVPNYLSHEEAATLPCAAVTAWQALVTEGALVAGQRVLVLGTGGVSIFALQIARMFGAETLVTSSSNAKLEQAKALGAHHGINYKEFPQWSKKVRELTNGRGVDHVVEVGGAGTLDESLRALCPGGQLSLIGILSGSTANSLLLAKVLMQVIRVQGIMVGPKSSFEAMNRAFEVARLKPVVSKVFPWQACREALTYMKEQHHVGKIVLKF